MNTVAVLFARRDSIYKSFSDCDVYDAERDAHTYRGAWPVIAHPPCGPWAGLAAQCSHADAEQRAHALYALRKVRELGGVLEHPRRSKLWPSCAFPMPGKGTDGFGGWSLLIKQSWFGHRAEKPTLLYIVGIAPDELPAAWIDFRPARYVIGGTGRRHRGDGKRGVQRPEVSKVEREATPEPLARWLVSIAQRAHRAARLYAA